MEKYISNSESDTISFAKDFAKSLNKNDIVVLAGDLGSGKTKFTQGILEYFGLDDEISSPTFTIVNEYKNDSISIFHFDVYRLNNENDFYDIGGEEYFGKGLCIIEWGEIIKACLPPTTIVVNIEKNKLVENERIITITKGIKNENSCDRNFK